MRCCEQDFEIAIPLAEKWTDGVASVIAEPAACTGLCSASAAAAEYWFCDPPRNGAEAAAAIDPELEAWFHLYMLNHGVLMTPFHNMSLMSSSHVAADVDRHTEVFADAVEPHLAR